MLSVPVELDIAHTLIRDRLRQAERDALVAQLIADAPQAALMRAVAAGRVRLAGSLRSLAGRLDPTLGCEPCLVVPGSR
jgi:hypothetical protein